MQRHLNLEDLIKQKNTQICYMDDAALAECVRAAE